MHDNTPHPIRHPEYSNIWTCSACGYSTIYPLATLAAAWHPALSEMMHTPTCPWLYPVGEMVADSDFLRSCGIAPLTEAL